MVKLYTQYIENFPVSAAFIEEAMTSNLNFTAFVVQAEKDNKVKFSALLELPLKKLPHYYIELQVRKINNSYYVGTVQLHCRNARRLSKAEDDHCSTKRTNGRYRTYTTITAREQRKYRKSNRRSEENRFSARKERLFSQSRPSSSSTEENRIRSI